VAVYVRERKGVYVAKCACVHVRVGVSVCVCVCVRGYVCVRGFVSVLVSMQEREGVCESVCLYICLCAPLAPRSELHSIGVALSSL